MRHQMMLYRFKTQGNRMANPRRLSSPRTRGSRSQLAEFDNGKWIPAFAGMTGKAEVIRRVHAIALLQNKSVLDRNCILISHNRNVDH